MVLFIQLRKFCWRFDREETRLAGVLLPSFAVSVKFLNKTASCGATDVNALFPYVLRHIFEVRNE